MAKTNVDNSPGDDEKAEYTAETASQTEAAPSPRSLVHQCDESDR